MMDESTISRPYGSGTVTWIPDIIPVMGFFQLQEVIWTPPRIVRTPGILGGKPRIDGRRISVEDIVIWHERMGLSVDAIATKYDLAPDDVHAALTYYAEHRNEIEESIRAGEAFIVEMRQHYPSKLKA